MKRSYVLLAISTLSLVCLAIAFIMIIYLSVPNEWNHVKLQDSKQELISHFGKSLVEENSWDVKGDVWTKDSFIGWYRLHVFYDSNKKVSTYTIMYYLGSKNDYIHWLIKSKS